MRIKLFAARLPLAALLVALVAGMTACTDDNDGYLRTDLGNRYELFKTGGGELPQEGDFVYFQAVMATESDSVLFDTRQNGGEPPVLRVAPDTVSAGNIGAVEDVIRYMRQGDSAIVRVNLDQFPAKPPGMEADSVIVYRIVTTETISEEEFNTRQAAVQEEARLTREAVLAREPEMLAFADEVYNAYKSGELDDELQETDSGLKYIIHEEGSGPQAMVNKGVVVQYIGKLVENGNVFDQSFQRGQGIPFPLGQGRVIPGWDQGIALLKEGARATLFIPSELGYGAQGAGGDIPPNSELMFYVELEDVVE